MEKQVPAFKIRERTSFSFNFTYQLQQHKCLTLADMSRQILISSSGSMKEKDYNFRHNHTISSDYQGNVYVTLRVLCAQVTGPESKCTAVRFGIMHSATFQFKGNELVFTNV
ncbi:hypothetical protein ACE6H2_018873 [Prunus campanulata]